MNNNNLIVLVVAAGVVIGVLAGIVTRPTHFGLQTPLGVMFSTYGGDKIFRDELVQHVGLATLIGAVTGGVLAAILSVLKKA